jgi:hypothetical protein
VVGAGSPSAPLPAARSPHDPDPSRATIEETIRAVVEADEFRTLWEEANRLAHQELSAVLAGEPLPLTTEADGLVEADLAPVYAELQARLHDAGITILDDVDPGLDHLTIALFPSQEIEDLRRYARWLNRIALALPLATAGAAILYVIASRRRWRAVFWLSLALMLGTLAVWLVVWLGRETAADHMDDDSAREAALAVYDTVTRTLRPQTVALALIGAGASLALAAVRIVRGRRPVAVGAARKEPWTMDETTLRTWGDVYVRAWTSNDPTEIGALFSEDALYRTSPHDEPWRGRDGIVAAWLERKDEPGRWSFAWEILAIAGDLGFVRGRTDYAATAEEAAEIYSNLWVIRLDTAGRCAEFSEWWRKWSESAG